MPDRMPEDMPEHMPEDMPDRMPDRMPEDMSDRMPEDLPVRTCINVMVGITQSKVFFLKQLQKTGPQRVPPCRPLRLQLTIGISTCNKNNLSGSSCIFSPLP